MMSLVIETPSDVAQLIGLVIVLPAIVVPAIDPEPTLSSAMPPPLPVTNELAIETGPIDTEIGVPLLFAIALRSTTSSHGLAAMPVVPPTMRARYSRSLPPRRQLAPINVFALT